MEKITVVIGSDHVGFELKQELLGYVTKYYEKEYEVENCGIYQHTISVNYSEIAHNVATLIRNHKADLGILICDFGIEMSIVANRHPKIRCTVCWSEAIAMVAKEHNNSNIIALPARFLTKEKAKRILDAFFNTTFQKERLKRFIC